MARMASRFGFTRLPYRGDSYGAALLFAMSEVIAKFQHVQRSILNRMARVTALFTAACGSNVRVAASCRFCSG